MKRGSTEPESGSPETLARWIKEKLRELKWTQKRLSDEARVSDTSISELTLAQTGLTLEMAEALASVVELEVTAEQLLRMAGKLRTDRLADIPGKRAAREDVARRIIASLPDEDLKLATDLLITLKKRKKK